MHDAWSFFMPENAECPDRDAFYPGFSLFLGSTCYVPAVGEIRRKGGSIMIITIRVSDLDGALIKRYASFHRETVSNLLKRLIMDRIEDDYQKLIEELEVKR